MLSAAEQNAGLKATIIAGESRIGGGAAPAAVLPTPEISLIHSRLSPDRLLAALRGCATPIIARIVEDAVRLNPRTLLGENELVALAQALAKLS